MANVLEATVERRLRNEVEKRGGRAVKLNPTNAKGIPDRLVLLPGGRVAFVELKRPKRGRVAAMQREWHGTLRRLGQEVAVLDSVEAVDAWLDL